MTHLFTRGKNRLRREWRDGIGNLRLLRMGLKVANQSRPQAGQKPVIFFNASTRLQRVSLNAAYALLSAWSLQLGGTPVVHFACRAGMSRCVLGTQRDHPDEAPPCRACVAQTRRLLLSAPVVWFEYQEDAELADQLALKNITELQAFTWSLAAPGEPEITIPLGTIVLPALRWILRCHHLVDDEPTRQLYRAYILSAKRVAEEFGKLLDDLDPQCVVLFNGQFFPEATARWLAIQRGIRVITHEVGLLPFTAFFTEGEATAYPLNIPDDFELTERENQQLDDYLSRRFQGQFSMAGIRFWSNMTRLDENFLDLASRFEQIVPVFTNVIFDTSQPHSNTVFPHMFQWLDMVLDVARLHPETLFVIRAHPDETRPGKESRESVQEWVHRSRAESLPNILFVHSRQPLSSYELIQRSKFIMIYNSTIGLEASILGMPVLCAGKSRFTQLQTVFFPSSQEEFRKTTEEFLAAAEIAVPPEFSRNARRFLFYQLFVSSLPLGDFLEEDGVWPGFVRLRSFHWQRLLPQNAAALRMIQDGILGGGDFMLKVRDV